MMKQMIAKILFPIFFLLLLNGCGIQKSKQDLPDLTGIEKIDTHRIRHNDSLFTIGKNSLSKNKYGIWELYIEGSPLELGMINGSLTRELKKKQENAIFERMESLVPPGGYQFFLAKVVAWFSRKMYLYVPEEYKAEIYGISRFSSHKYDNFAPPYLRSLYLHGAHDIGHALQDFMLVGCTSFAAWDSKTQDGQLLLGRNFDFYAGDEFAEEKIIAFINPDQGHKFMMYTWPGMTGAVSGMNEKGITVTINAGKTRLPLIAKTPITLVAREILQYAENTDQAIEIARRREVFVSEAIMVGSASERKAILIEVSPGNIGVYEVDNSNQLVCSNHFQSKTYAEDKRNLKSIAESHSKYRYKRMEELLAQNDALTPEKAAGILRNKDGLMGAKLGLGNEKALNQLLAHHGIIFKPEEGKVWVSANPYQLGAFVAYDLDEAFKKFEAGNTTQSVSIEAESIPEDDFIHTKAYREYKGFRVLNESLSKSISAGEKIPVEKINELIGLNPYYWKVYALAGEYYFQQKNYKKAIIYFKQARSREVTTLLDEQDLEKMIRKSYRKL
jgi:tetratricopeptide (TPR) repeat protein